MPIVLPASLQPPAPWPVLPVTPKQVGNPFKYRAFDLTTGNVLDTLPHQGVNFSRGPVNQAGSWAGQLPITDPGIGWNPVTQSLGMDWPDATRPGRTALIVDLYGVPVWGGIIWTRTYQKSQPVLKIGAMEFGSYFASRLQADDYSATWTAPNPGAVPTAVATKVINDALAYSNNILGGIALVVNSQGTYVPGLANPSYPGTSLQTIDSILQILSQAGYTYGFDYSFDVTYLPGTTTPAVTLNLFYPRKGRTADQSGLVVLGRHTSDYYYPEDATQMATEVTETGSGTGGVQPEKLSENIAGYPPLQRAFPRTLVNDDATLANIAVGDLGLYCYPVVAPWVELPLTLPNPQGVIPPVAMALGKFDSGDDLLWRIDPVAGGGLNTDPRFPYGMSFEWRINDWKVTVPDKGTGTLHLDLCIPPLQVIPPPPPPM